MTPTNTANATLSFNAAYQIFDWVTNMIAAGHFSNPTEAVKVSIVAALAPLVHKLYVKYFGV